MYAVKPCDTDGNLEYLQRSVDKREFGFRPAKLKANFIFSSSSSAQVVLGEIRNA